MISAVIPVYNEEESLAELHGQLTAVAARAVAARVSPHQKEEAFLGGLLLSPLFNTSTINDGNFSLPGLFVSFLGAVILLAFVSLFRRRPVH